MTAPPPGYRRTGLCPTFAHPVQQRDGYLLRLPLVGGLLDAQQVDAVADVASRAGSGTIELTNRGNLQIRGLAADRLPAALEACAGAGLGDLGASLVTVSPLAGGAEHALRQSVLAALDGLDLGRLSPKFAAHIDDRDRLTAGRASDVLVQPGSDTRFELSVRGLGSSIGASAEEVARVVRAVAERCIDAGPQVRTADLLVREGASGLANSLGGPLSWQSPRARPAPAGLQVQVGLHATSHGLSQPVALVGVRFGRIASRTLAGLGALLLREPGVTLRVTPWRSMAFACANRVQAEAVLHAAAELGLLVDANDPSLGVIPCIGARGCWQTQLDTLAEAERVVAHARLDVRLPGVVHISGCDKRCATRAAVALTLLGRADQTGFDEIRTVSE